MYLLLPLITWNWDPGSLAREMGLVQEKPHPPVTSQGARGISPRTDHLVTAQSRPGQVVDSRLPSHVKIIPWVPLATEVSS